MATRLPRSAWERLPAPGETHLHPSQRLTHGEKLEWQRVRHELPDPILVGIELSRSAVLDVCDQIDAKHYMDAEPQFAPS